MMLVENKTTMVDDRTSTHKGTCFVFFKIRLKSSTLSRDTNVIALPVAPARAVLFSCPCCGYKLRKKPRSLKYKARLKAEIEEDKILLSV